MTSWRTYKEGDSEIQHQHLATELPTLIEAYGYEHTILDVEDEAKAISQIEACDTTETICIIKKDSFTKVELLEKHQLDFSNLIARSEFLIKMNETFKDTNNFYMAGNMGGLTTVGRYENIDQ